MAQAPVMPLFTDALIGDTTHLSTEQFGAYVLIMIATWRNNGKPLPDDDKQLANVTRAGLQKWKKKLRPVVSQFFTIDAAGWHQNRLETEWLRVSALIAKRRAIGSTGGRSKATRANARLAGLDGTSSTRPTHNQREPLVPHQDSSDDHKPESDVGRAREGQKKIKMNPLGAAARHLDRADARPVKGPALKARIKQQLVWKHCRFLKARGRPDEWQSYFNQIDATTKLPPDEAFEAVDARMRAERWDDMRAWKWQHGIPCDGNDTAPEARPETASALLVRTGGWYHGKAAAPA